MIQVTNSWETNEILLTNKGSQYVLYREPFKDGRWSHGTSDKGSIAIDLKEALQLLYDLEMAIENYKNLDKGLEEINKNDIL